MSYYISFQNKYNISHEVRKSKILEQNFNSSSKLNVIVPFVQLNFVITYLSSKRTIFNVVRYLNLCSLTNLNTLALYPTKNHKEK